VRNECQKFQLRIPEPDLLDGSLPTPMHLIEMQSRPLGSSRIKHLQLPRPPLAQTLFAVRQEETGKGAPSSARAHAIPAIEIGSG
jgi:hypothetical protein